MTTRPGRRSSPTRPARRPGHRHHRKPTRPVDDPDGPYAITGRVSVEGTGEPVPGARLVVRPGFRRPESDPRRIARQVPATSGPGPTAGSASRSRPVTPRSSWPSFPPGYFRGKSRPVVAGCHPVPEVTGLAEGLRRAAGHHLGLPGWRGAPAQRWQGAKVSFMQPGDGRGFLRPIRPIRQGDPHPAAGRAASSPAM